jgi:hypothetical protein
MLSEEEKIETMTHLIDSISADNFQNIIATVEFIRNISDEVVLKFLEGKIKEKVKTADDEIIWNLLAHTRK